MDDRFTAFKILSKIERDSAYSNLALDAALEQQGSNSTAFVSALVYGVTERKITLDWCLTQLLSKPIKKLDPRVLTALRMGTYQLKYMDKVPFSAAVNESVKLTKKCGCAYASGLVNSVLRKVAEADFVFPKTSNPAFDLSVEFSCGEELARAYIEDYGVDTAREFLKASLGAVPTVVRVNTLKTNPAFLTDLLTGEGFKTEKCDENSLIVSGGSLKASKAYKDGLFFVQDLASQRCVTVLDPKPNETVFDMCAAPGGKSFSSALLMENRGSIYSFDLHSHRAELISKGASRLGIDIISASEGDASVFNPNLPVADRILCDVPCSGTGVIRRKPEIKYKNLAFIDKLNDLQYNILNCSSRYLKQGGTLVYSTCSVLKKENEQICERFLSENPDFKTAREYDTLMPHTHGCDGFFIAKFIKG